MGTWGTSITSDDTVQDVIAEYIRLFNRKLAPQEIVAQMLRSNADMFDDSDDGPLMWIAIAKAQWDCGQLQPAVLDQVRNIVTQGIELDRRAEAGDKSLAARRKVLDKFLLQIQTPKPKPRKPRKAIKRRPIFQPGDCVAMRLPDGDWGGVFILRHPPESEDPSDETYGFNRAVVLDFRGPEPPTLAVFEQRRWRHKQIQTRWFRVKEWKDVLEVWDIMSPRFRTVKDAFRFIGAIPLRDSDQIESGQMITLDHMLTNAPAARTPPAIDFSPESP